MSKINSIINSLEKEKEKMVNKNFGNNFSEVETLSKNVENVTKAINCLQKVKTSSLKKNNNKNIIIKYKNINLKKIKINGNGQCFYSSIGEQLNPKENGVHVKNVISEYVIKYITQNKTKLINNIKKKITNSNNNNMKQGMANSIYNDIIKIIEQTAINIAREQQNRTKIPSDKVIYLKDNENTIIVHDPIYLINHDLEKWGGVHMIQLISTIYNINIIVYNEGQHDSSKSFINYSSDLVNSKDTIYLYYNGRNHYDALVPI